jgi:hypothetical protein
LHCAVLFLVICCSVGILTGLSDWREWRVIGMASDCGRNAQQIVSYRDISNRA